MERFVTRHTDRIAGILSGFDRMLFRGSLRSLAYSAGLQAYRATHQILLKDFGAWVQARSTALKTHAEQVAASAARPYGYLPSSRDSKEARARAIVAASPVREGLICVFACVEPVRP